MEKIIFKGIVGSHAFGTNRVGSDIDIAEIYMCDNDDLLGLYYKEHDDYSKDYRRYELNKVIRLLMNGNPNMLELLYLPDDCVLQTSPEWEYIKKHRQQFLTKKLYETFAGYARTQIKKAKGLNKKINWEKDQTERKTVLDFCYIFEFDNTNTKAIPVKDWLKQEGYAQEEIGLVGLDHVRNGYLFYIDEMQWLKSNNPRYKSIETLNFNGIVSDENIANDVNTSSVPKYCIPVGMLFFNRDAYSTHCKDYASYQKWLQERNIDRFQTNKNHGQEYDSKNIAHVVRLLKTARDIVETNSIKVRRSPQEIEYLLKIKSGQENLSDLVDWSEREATELKSLYDLSDLPEDVSENFCNYLILKLRHGINS